MRKYIAIIQQSALAVNTYEFVVAVCAHRLLKLTLQKNAKRAFPRSEAKRVSI